MQNIKSQIALELKKVVKELTGLDVIVSLDRPKDEEHGDYSSNIALTIFSSSKFNPSTSLRARVQSSKFRTPMDLAEKIVNKLEVISEKLEVIEKVEVVAPGFINFYLSKDYLVSRMSSFISSKDILAEEGKLVNQKIMVEFTDPNPFKEFHIGHLYSNTVGESICRLLESQKALVLRVCYQGDVGLHVAKALYGVLRLCHAEFISASEILKNEILKQVQDDNLSNRIKFLGQAYALGVKAYEEDESAKKEIEKINKEVYDGNSSVMDIYKKGRKWSLEYFDSIYKRLGTKFKKFYFESEAGKIGLEIVKKNIDKVFKKSYGAIIFPGGEYSLHNRVFINSLGLPTYEAKDLGLAATKYKDCLLYTSPSPRD